MTELATLLDSLTPAQLAELKKLIFVEMAETSAIADSPGMTMVYNRSPKPFEFQWDSTPYVINGHDFAVYPDGIARHAIRKGQYLHVGTPEVKQWVVPKGYEGFGVPMPTTGLTGDPIKDYPIDLRATEVEVPVGDNQREVFSLDKLPPPPPNEPRPLAKKTRADNSIGFSEGAKIAGAVKE